jgi:hypothetical protein
MKFAAPTAVATVILVAVLVFVVMRMRGYKEKYGAWGNNLRQGESLQVGQALQSWTEHGHSKLVMQWDGNLVLYLNDRAIWASNTSWGWRYNGYECRMQEDGNLVIYDKNSWQAIWASDTWQSRQYDPYSPFYYSLDLNGRCFYVNYNMPTVALRTLKTFCGYM